MATTTVPPQILAKEFKCYNCQQPVLLSKLDSPQGKKKWQSWELDKVTIHDCNKPKTNNYSSNDNIASELKLIQSQLAEINKKLDIILTNRKS